MAKMTGKGISASGLLGKWLGVLLVIALCGFALAGCANDDAGDGTSTTVAGDGTTPGNSGTTSPDGSNAVFTDEAVTDSNIFDFVSLGEYKGITYTPISPEPVTDEDIIIAIEGMMSEEGEMTEVTDRPVQRNDTVIIDFVGYVDGVPFDGGAADGAELVIGSGMFIPGFEEQIIGKNLGDEFDIHVTFPEEYEESLAGKAAVFKTVLHNIFYQSFPELNDDYVMFYFGVESLAVMKDQMREQMTNDRALDAQNESRYQVWSVVFRSSTILKYPNAEVDFRIRRAMMEFEYYSEIYGMDLDDLIYQMTEGMYQSTDAFIDGEMRQGAIDDVGQDLVLRAIGSKEGLSVSDQEFQAGVVRLVSEYGYESEEQFLEINGESAVRIALLSDKVIEMLMSNAIAQ